MIVENECGEVASDGKFNGSARIALSKGLDTIKVISTRKDATVRVASAMVSNEVVTATQDNRKPTRCRPNQFFIQCLEVGCRIHRARVMVLIQC